MALMVEALLSRAAWPEAPVAPAGCWTATVGICPRDVLMTTGTCMATRTVLQSGGGGGDKEAVRQASRSTRGSAWL